MGFGSDKTGFYKPSAVTVTATGNPLTLQNAKRLRKLTIYGNAVQDGTPSPDAPVEVQLCGDKTGNLLDVSEFEDEPDGYVENGSIYVTGYIYQPGITPEDFLEMTGLQVGDEITTTANYKRLVTPSGSNGAEYIIFLRKQGNGEFLPLFRPNTVLNWTVPTDFNSSNYYAMYIYGGSTQTDDGSPRSVWSNLAIYKGSYTADTLPAYEPYGYKVSGRAEGLNLLSSAWEDGNINISTGNNEGVAGRIRTADHIKCKPNTVYTFYTPYSVIGVRGYDADKTYLDFFPNTVSSSTLTFTTNENVEYLRFITQSSDGTQPDKTLPYMLVQGSYTAETMPPYEPYQPPQDFAVYLPEQIAKVGDVADEVVVDMESKTAELKKKYFRYDFTGDENWSYEKSRNRFNLKLNLGLKGKRYKTPSNRFETTNIAGDKDGLIFAYYNAIYVYHYDSTTKEELNAFLTDNPTYAYIPYSTPVTTDITSLQQWDAMPQVSGTVTLTLSAEVGPSGAEAVYTASKRPKPQAALIEENTITEEPAETQVSDTDINTEIIMMED